MTGNISGMGDSWRDAIREFVGHYPKAAQPAIESYVDLLLDLARLSRMDPKATLSLTEKMHSGLWGLLLVMREQAEGRLGMEDLLDTLSGAWQDDEPLRF